jgi:type VI secretion system secreted protein VgrG
LVGAEKQSYPLPALPKAAFEPVPIELNLRLQDIPGNDGVPLMNAPWQILLMRNRQMVEQKLCEGRTDATGKLNLSGDEQKLVAETYAARPNDVWVRSRGSLRPLQIAFERPGWSVDRKAVEAMASLDYSAQPHTGLGGTDPDRDESVSRMDTGSTAHALWEQLKKL